MTASPTAPPRTMRELIDRAAASRPDAAYALATESGERVSYTELAASCRGVTAFLRRHGVGAGAIVSLVMPNGLGTVRLLLGALHGGVAVNPVNLLSQPEQMAYVLGHSDCKLVFATADWEARVRELLQRVDRPVELVVVDAERLGSAFNGDEHTDAPSPDALGLLMYTSGTTGQPKGVMLTQANLAANALAISAEHGLGPEDRVLAVLPLYHINAFAVTMLAPLAHGGSLAMPPRFSAARFWDQAARSGCTWINVVPTMISYLLEGAAPPRGQTARLRFCRSASAALPPEHLRAFEQKFGTYFEMYGAA